MSIPSLSGKRFPRGVLGGAVRAGTEDKAEMPLAVFCRRLGG